MSYCMYIICTSIVYVCTYYVYSLILVEHLRIFVLELILSLVGVFAFSIFVL